MKRIFDYLLALALVPVALPVVGIAMLAIRLESPGPALFRQTRVGRDERPFTCYKLRTMRSDTVDGPSHEIGTTSITRSGSFLRRTKIDELPQIANILKGEMSLVGPRPCLPSQEELREERRTRGVYRLLPGITGVAQVAGYDMSEPERLARKDAEYIGRETLGNDLKIILQTVMGGGQGDAASKL